jgi:pimeloyl-ACP methyl ester carboxylesterase
LAFAVALTACHTPIGARRSNMAEVYKRLTTSGLTGDASDESLRVLHRCELTTRFDKDPDGALLALHEKACSDDRRDTIFALCELNYLRGQQLSRSVKPGEAKKAADKYLAASVYGWCYLMGKSHGEPPDPFDRRLRMACDLYNRAVALAFLQGAGHESEIRLVSGQRQPGPGPVNVEFRRAVFKWDLNQIEKFLPADEFMDYGLSVRDRQSGVGAPIIAVGKKLDQKRFPRRIPATLLLRAPDNLKEWSSNGLTVSLELYSSYEADHVVVDERKIPLQSDTSATLAYALNDASIWKLGTAQFFSSEEVVKSGIYFTQPYEYGQIPVVFIHGTFSSPVWWAEMWNTLRADPVLRNRYQFWNFIYNTGNPVTYSAARLHSEIERTSHQLDPDGKDPALKEMVLIGHSQGGLLAKLMAVDTQDQLWRTFSTNNFDSVKLKPKDRKLLENMFFFTPLPQVRRVVFISTPHRGSYRASSFVRRLLYRFIKLPSDLLKVSSDLVTLQLNDPSLEARRAVPTSLDSMSPENKTLLTLAAMPLAPGVVGHSIIAVKGDGPLEDGNDGIVAYSSAHVDGMASEFVVRCGHSCQANPATIEEVRRILLEHLKQLHETSGTSPAETIVHPNY